MLARVAGLRRAPAPRTTYRVHCGIPGLERPDTTVEAFTAATAAVLGARALGLGEVTDARSHEHVDLWDVSGPRGFLALVTVHEVQP